MFQVRAPKDIPPLLGRSQTRLDMRGIHPVYANIRYQIERTAAEPLPGFRHDHPFQSD